MFFSGRQITVSEITARTKICARSAQNRIWTRGEGGWGEIKVDPPSEFFCKICTKNATKKTKRFTLPKNFHNPYIPSLLGKNLMDMDWIFKPCASMAQMLISSFVLTTYYCIRCESRTLTTWWPSNPEKSVGRVATPHWNYRNSLKYWCWKHFVKHCSTFVHLSIFVQDKKRFGDIQTLLR